MKIKPAFCANCQAVTDHTVTIDGNGEYLFTCECGRSLKFPNTMSAKELKAALSAHEEANQGQVSFEVLERDLDAKLADL